MLSAGRLIVQVPSAFYASWLSARFGGPLREAAQVETGKPHIEVEWKICPQRFSESATQVPDHAPQVEPSGVAHVQTAGTPPAASQHTKVATSASHSARLRHTLDEFVVGPSNELAYATAKRLADPTIDAGFSVLVVHGRCGVGKTHLLQGIVGAARNMRAGVVRYVTAEAFTNEYIRAVRSGELDSFRRRTRALDVLCIDDVHFLAGKSATQIEFLHTFDELIRTGSRVALATDESPREIANLSEHLVSRCLAGMVVQIDSPDIETRRRIIRRGAGHRGLQLEEAQVEQLAAEAFGSVRDIEGALNRLFAMVQLAPSAGAAGCARRAVALTRRSPAAHPIRLSAIVAACADVYGVSVDEIAGPRRSRIVVEARSLAAYLGKELTRHSYPEIARALGRPNHSTAYAARQRIMSQLEHGASSVCGCDQSLREMVELVQRRVASAR